jgi:hypothetical protein
VDIARPNNGKLPLADQWRNGGYVPLIRGEPAVRLIASFAVAMSLAVGGCALHPLPPDPVGTRYCSVFTGVPCLRSDATLNGRCQRCPDAH